MIPVVIPTMPQRAGALRMLLIELRAYPWTLPVVSPHVDSRQDVARALARVTLADPTAPWFLYLEDDVRLSPEFGRIAGILTGHLDDQSIGAICFFHCKDDLPFGLIRLPASKMSMSQCTALRALDPTEFSVFADRWYRSHPQHHHASDLLLGAWVSHRGQEILVHSPSLVQHRPLKSTLGPRARNRQSESYRRAFGEIA